MVASLLRGLLLGHCFCRLCGVVGVGLRVLLLVSLFVFCVALRCFFLYIQRTLERFFLAFLFTKWFCLPIGKKNAFLLGYLSSCMYMEQPSGFQNPNLPTHVCCLNHALYDLKQASHVWFTSLHIFLLKLGFLVVVGQLTCGIICS